MIYQFNLNKKEELRAEAFQNIHKNCIPENKSVSGPLFSCIFTPTKLGNEILIKCNICEKAENITDLSNW